MRGSKLLDAYLIHTYLVHAKKKKSLHFVLSRKVIAAFSGCQCLILVLNKNFRLYGSEQILAHHHTAFSLQPYC